LEVKNDFTLDQAQLQSMVSGEPVSIMRKNKTALSTVWKVPGILAGNEPASWTDNSGSMSRRIVMCFFDRKVTAEMVDPHLDTKIKANIGNFLHKCASAYNAAVSEFGNKDIWSSYVDADGDKDTILPRYFHSAKMRLQIVTDPLMSFLRSDTSIRLTNSLLGGMPWERFKAIASVYFSKEGHKGFLWKENKYKAVFEDLGIKKTKIDAKFIADNNQGGHTFVDSDMQEYGLGTEWLVGIDEKKEKVYTADI
jgi:phage/plasmid-associated DNA primase